MTTSYTKLFAVAAAAHASTYNTKRQCTERQNEQRRAERATNVSTKESEAAASVTWRIQVQEIYIQAILPTQNHDY